MSVKRPVARIEGVTQRYGNTVALDTVTIDLPAGCMVGFIGPDGVGKSSLLSIIAGARQIQSGNAFVLDGSMADSAHRAATCPRIAYMPQGLGKNLYADLSVRENIEFFGRLFGQSRSERDRRIAELLHSTGLAPFSDRPAKKLSGGMRQKLGLCCCLVHDPDLLILDEPTSGVDPLARDRFWELLIDLSRNQGVTIFVSTHFMNEAERCDRISLMDSGRVLATGTPAELVKGRGAPTLEDAFIGYLEEATGSRASAAEAALPVKIARPVRPTPERSWFSLQRLFAYTIRETLELLRDPIRLGFSVFGTTLLMLVFGFGVTTDINNLSFAVLDHDQSPESRAYLEELRGSTYFTEKPPLADYGDLERRLQSGDIRAAIEIPPGFGRDIKRGRPAWVGAWVDGAMPFRAETIRGYLQGMHQLYLTDPAVKTTVPASLPPADIEVRFKYNQDFDSIYAMVPANMSLLLALFPAILMALAIVREKELGSITNLYVTPVSRIEFLFGKQLPYIAVAMTNFALLLVMALFVFQVPLKGSFATLLLGALIYVTTTTAYGMLISAFTRTQIAALFGTAILTVLPATQFAGMMTPVSSLAGGAQIIGRGFPMTYFVPISVGTFTKGLGFSDLAPTLAALAVFIPVLTLLNVLLLRKQER
ncbi:MAG TPA: ABC transporter permease [Sphingomicrobium sp.]|nr:ABC transporter permease [Sphingomicrobium sp.]